MKKILESNRTFSPWVYTVSHSMLVLRSSYGASKGEDNNIDLYFTSVDYMAIPATFKGLTVEEDSEMKEIDLLHRYSPSSDSKVFILTSGGERYFVIAYRVSVDTNNLGLMEVGHCIVPPKDPTNYL